MEKNSDDQGAEAGSREKGLTGTQRQILDYIRSRCREGGVPPSYREIQVHFGYKAIGTVQDHLKALRQKGALEETSPKGKRRPARGILPRGHRPANAKVVPIYGEIAAGSARDSAQLEFGDLLVSDTISERPDFALRVVGNSMVDAGIYEGDLLIVERRAPIRNGDIIVALLDGETTVKRYRRQGEEILLIPENRFMKPIRVTTQRFEIQGKVVGLQRKI